MLSRYNLRSKSKQPQLIFSLPKEILELIFNYIPQNQTLNLRLVCKAWNQDVETLYNYEIKYLDEDSRHFQRFLELRIHKLSFTDLMETSVLNSEGISIFKHPKVIRVLKIELFSSVSPKNLQQLLSMCAENVRVVHLDLSHGQINYEFPMEQVLGGYKFTNLKDLQITYSRICMNPPHPAAKDNSRNLFQVLENSGMPQLKKLQVRFYSSNKISPDTRSRIGESIMRILSRNGIHLEILKLNFFDFREKFDQLEFKLQKEELHRIMQMDRVQEFDVNFKPFILQLQNFWQQFLSNQKQLVKLKTSEDFPGGRTSIPLCRQIIMNNSATLVNIEIWELEIRADDPPFDLSVFGACQNLKELYLHRTDLPRTIREQPDVNQFHCLPESITELIFVALEILSEELLVGFTQGFKNLRKMCIVECGMRGPLGLNWPVLSSILITPRPILTHVCLIDAVNCEDESLGVELGRIGLSLSDLYDLRRETGSYSVEPGYFDWVHNDEYDDRDCSND